MPVQLRIGVFRREKQGELEFLSEHDFDYYGVCPVIGDVIVWPQMAEMGSQGFFEIIERYYMNDHTYPGWALVVEEISQTKHLIAVSREWEHNRMIDRRLATAKNAETRLRLLDIISRVSDSERKRYPRLYPTASEYKLHREFPPDGEKSPIHPPLESWEKRTLNFLLQYTPKKRLPISAVEGLGTATRKALLARGYIGIEDEGAGKNVRTMVWITKKAIDDVKADKAFHSKYVPGELE